MSYNYFLSLQKMKDETNHSLKTPSASQ